MRTYELGERRHAGESVKPVGNVWRRQLPVCRSSVPLRTETLLHLHCSVTDRTRHSQDQPTNPGGEWGGDQIIFTEERFTLDKPSSSFSTFHHHHLSLLCYVKNWGEIWNTVIPKTFLLNLRSKSMFSARAHTHPHTYICTSIFVRALLGRMYEPASCRKPSPFHNPNLNLNPILSLNP